MMAVNMQHFRNNATFSESMDDSILNPDQMELATKGFQSGTLYFSTSSFLSRSVPIVSTSKSKVFDKISLLERCRKGDTNAIRLYCDYFKDFDAEVAEDNGLLDALNRKANEVFTDED